MPEPTDAAAVDGPDDAAEVDLASLPLHDPDRRLDLAFVRLGRLEDDSLIDAMASDASIAGVPPLLRSRGWKGTWVQRTVHPLEAIDPADHLKVHRAWLEACHGPKRMADVVVRTSMPLQLEGGGSAPRGSYSLTIIDLIGTAEIDAVVVLLDPVPDDESNVLTFPIGRPSRSFRLQFDRAGTILGGTESVGALFGHSLESLVGRGGAGFVHPDDRSAANVAWQGVINDPEQTHTARVRLRHGDGRWRWFAITTFRTLTADDGSDLIIIEYHDIDDMVQAEQALRASEVSFRTLAESMPVGVAVLDEGGHARFANHRLVTVLAERGLAGPDSRVQASLPHGVGYTALWTDLVDPSLATQVQDLVRPGDPNDAVPRHQHVVVEGADDTSVHLLIEAVTIERAETKLVIVSVQDVTDETEMLQAHTRLMDVVEEIDDVVIVSTLGGPVTYMNAAARRFLGDHAMGFPIVTFLRDRLRSTVQREIQPLLEANSSWTGDLDMFDLDDVAHTMSVSIVSVNYPGDPETHLAITMRDVTEARAQQRELAHLARHDSLTGLPNRHRLMEILEETRQRGRPDDSLAVIFIDLDNLKIVNDGLGHSAGDRLLVAVARELERVADDDAVARFGGDEFVVICPGLSEDKAMGRAQQFLGAVEQAGVAGVANRVTASIGVSVTLCRDADPEHLLRTADAAMYAAKHAGRARCAMFDTALRTQVERRFHLEGELQTCIEEQAIDVHFQPIVAAADGRVAGVEALARWGAVSPMEFIAVAEDSGLIVPLGEQILHRALERATALRASRPSLADLRVGINVSARELDTPGFADRTIAAIEASGIPPNEVVLELTESVLINPREEVDTTIRNLHDAGIRLALDDFGTGYSSLSYLRRYPLDIVKLDISYTQSVMSDPETRIIVEAVVTMADRLGLDIVAEGIESQAHFDTVKDLGVRFVQGFFFSRAASVEDLLLPGAPLGPDVNPR